VTVPLILQIQQAALDSNASVTDALRRAKVACAKLGLAEFGGWVDRELNGYMGIPVAQLPAYRKLHGKPEFYNPFHGWQPILFGSNKAAEIGSFAPVGMSIPAIEESLRDAKADGSFEFPYPPEIANEILGGRKENIHIRLSVPAVADILHRVRTIVLEWTLEMKKQGVLGDGLIFSEEDRVKSALATASTINNINIEQVGAFVQSAQDSTIQGTVNATLDVGGIRQLVKYVEQLLPAADLPAAIKENTKTTLEELKQAADGSGTPDAGPLRKALGKLKRVLAPAGEHLLRIGVDAAVTKILGGG
jgi:hypothetical protein